MDNQQLIAECLAEYAQIPGPRVGDFVIFPDGHEERCAHDMSRFDIDMMQTYPGGSFALGRGFVSHSGALNPGIPKSHLWPQRLEYRLGSCWIADRDYLTAGCAVDIRIPWRVFRYDPEHPYTGESQIEDTP